MTTASDYIGRKVDLSIFGNVPDAEGGERLLTQNLFDGGIGRVVTGAQKVAQWFLIKLLTIPGDDPYAPDDGCNFMLDAIQGAWRTTGDVFLSFASAKADILDQLAAVRETDDKADDVFADAVLESVELNAGYAVIFIRVLTAAGSSRQLIAPLPIVV